MNQLIAALPNDELQRLYPLLEPIELTLGRVLYDVGSSPGYVWFPTDGIVSLVAQTGSGSTSEIAVVGNEGVVGVGLLMGGETMLNRAVVQRAGRGLRLAASVFRAALYPSSPVLRLLLRYTQALMAQLGQVAVCNRHHNVRQQLCRWMLMSLDRLPGNELVTTQLRIASMLGVRREGVTEAALQLQRDGLIRCSRGRILVVDRKGLERQCCECYAVVSNEYGRLLPSQQPGLRHWPATGHAAEAPPAKPATHRRTGPGASHHHTRACQSGAGQNGAGQNGAGQRAATVHGAHGDDSHRHGH